ncbi:MAG: hypothetical protein K6T83_23840, partial [Alicyclobacillus sp.]|nr:hypothetical protein [Alicyclobacillus sp.]
MDVSASQALVAGASAAEASLRRLLRAHRPQKRLSDDCCGRIGRGSVSQTLVSDASTAEASLRRLSWADRLRKRLSGACCERIGRRSA